MHLADRMVHVLNVMIKIQDMFREVPRRNHNQKIEPIQSIKIEKLFRAVDLRQTFCHLHHQKSNQDLVKVPLKIVIDTQVLLKHRLRIK